MSGEVAAHVKGIKNALLIKKLDKAKIEVLPGGFRNRMTLEFWMVPEGAAAPVPDSTIDKKNVKFGRLFKDKMVPYDCCGY